MRWIGVFVAICCCSPVAASTLTFQESWRDSVKIETLKVDREEASFPLFARLRYNEERTRRLVAPYAGRVSQVWVREGARVRSGTPLAEIMSPEIASLRGELGQAKTELALAQQHHRRATALLKDGALATRDMLEAQSAEKKAEANIQRLEAHIGALGFEVQGKGASGILRAPMDGVVTVRAVHPGTTLTASEDQVLFVVSDLATLWVEADLFDENAAQIRPGTSVDIEMASQSGKKRRATVLHVGHAVHPITRAIPVRLSLDNHDGSLRPDMVATVMWPQPGPGLWVDTSAIVWRGAQPAVWIVKDATTLERREVEIGPSREGRTFVRHGVMPNDRCVCGGALLLDSVWAR